MMNMPASRVNEVPNLQQFAHNTQQPMQMPSGVLPPSQNKPQNEPSEEKAQFNYRQEEPGEDN